LFTGWVRWVEAQRSKARVTALIGVSQESGGGKELALSQRAGPPRRPAWLN
jgi:hypothetical protein